MQMVFFVVCKIVNSISYEFGGVLSKDYHSVYRFKMFLLKELFYIPEIIF